MFFILSKTIGFFAAPSNVLITLGLLGILLLATRFRRAGGRLVVASVLLLAVCGLSPLGNMLMLPLEERFPRWDPSRGDPDGIVVLGGMFDNLVATGRDTLALTDAAERITAAVALARRHPQTRIVFSGGSAALFYRGVTEAELALRLFDDLGVARERVMVDDRSRNTVENAEFSKAIATPKPGERWLLVTSAYHMARSIGTFRRVGFAVEAYPVDWRTPGPTDRARFFPSLADGLKRTDTAAREWLGLLAYWVTGKTSALFPAP